MNIVKKYIKAELKNWKAIEVFWLLAAVITILILSIYWKDNWIGITAAVTGVACVVLTGKGKLSSYIFGLINILFYAYTAYYAKYYGEVMLNMLYYLPMNFVGWYAWHKNMDEETGEVVKKRMSVRNSVIVFLVTGIAIFIYGLILRAMGGNLPFVDSMSTVVSVVAQILCIKRYVEQWILWIVVDIVTVIMWIAAFFTGGESVATLLMWSIYLINAIIMFIKWNKEAAKN
ncbi:MAG: nicotinamide riboside transporter PnuC [Lachnospiraceae bacterium]|nr:nicotinamide riboside transporter PnuC [Lachnospiraceae bacterium]